MKKFHNFRQKTLLFLDIALQTSLGMVCTEVSPQVISGVRQNIWKRPDSQAPCVLTRSLKVKSSNPNCAKKNPKKQAVSIAVGTVVQQSNRQPLLMIQAAVLWTSYIFRYHKVSRCTQKISTANGGLFCVPRLAGLGKTWKLVRLPSFRFKLLLVSYSFFWVWAFSSDRLSASNPALGRTENLLSKKIRVVLLERHMCPPHCGFPNPVGCNLIVGGSWNRKVILYILNTMGSEMEPMNWQMWLGSLWRAGWEEDSTTKTVPIRWLWRSINASDSGLPEHNKMDKPKGWKVKLF